jgi:hypothetical protein
VRQVPPAYAKPFHQIHKNGFRDAYANRGRRATTIDTVHAGKDRRSDRPLSTAPGAISLSQRTAEINRIRGFLLERGIASRRGPRFSASTPPEDSGQAHRRAVAPYDQDGRRCLLPLRNPFQGREPEIMATVHEALIGLAQMDSVLALANLIRNDEACIATGLQIPGMVEGRCRAGRVAVPADASVRGELVRLTFDRQPERGPSKHSAVLQHRIASDLDLPRIRIPFGPLIGVDDVAPNARARGVDQQLVVREQIGL